MTWTAPTARPVHSIGGARATAGLVATLAGGFALLLSFTSLRWFSVPMPEGGEALIPFSALADYDVGGEQHGITALYYTRAAVALAALSFLLAGAAQVAARGRTRLRAAGVLVAAVAIAATCAAVRVTAAASFSQWWSYSAPGFRAALAGFVLCGVGAAVAPGYPHSDTRGALAG